MNPEPRVDDGCRILAHLTGADRMMNGAAMLLHEMLNFIAGLYVRSRRELAEANFLQRGRREDAAADLDTRDNDVDVVVVREIRGTDNGVGERIAAAGH